MTSRICLCLCILCGSWCLSLPQASANRRTQYREYRKLRKLIYKKYLFAVKKRYAKPCRAKARLEVYESWTKQFLSGLPDRKLSRRYQRYLRSRTRYFARLGRRRHRWCQKRCRRYWKAELKRVGSGLRPKCKTLEALQPSDGAWFWVGARPWAHVYLNGTLCGTAPFRALLRPGAYKVRLSFPPGRDEYKTTLDLVAGAKPTLIVRKMQSTPPPSRRFVNLLSPKQLKFSVEKQRSDFASCRIYQSSTNKVVLSWEVRPDGKPQSIEWVSPDNPSKRFKRCIIRAASRMRFPKIKGAARIRSYAISLQ